MPLGLSCDSRSGYLGQSCRSSGYLSWRSAFVESSWQSSTSCSLSQVSFANALKPLPQGQRPLLNLLSSLGSKILAAACAIVSTGKDSLSSVGPLIIHQSEAFTRHRAFL